MSTKRYYVSQIQFEGNSSFAEHELRGVTKLREPVIFSRFEFNRRVLKLDAITLKNFYVSNGFLNASVRDSFAVEGKDRVNIFFQIDEGTQSFLRSVSIEGNDAIPETEIMKLLNLEIDRPFNPIGVRQGFSRLDREYWNIGKLFASIKPNHSGNDNIDLHLVVKEGPTVRIDKTVVHGLTAADSSFVLREIGFKTGTIYNEELVELSQRQIFETGLFSLVNILPVKGSKGDDWVNINVELREFQRRELLVEPGISRIPPTSEGGEPISGIGLTLQGYDRRIIGSGWRFGIKGSIDTPVEAIQRAFGEAIFRAEATLSGLWIYRWRVPSTLRLFAERVPDLAAEEAFLVRYGGEWLGLHRFSEESILQGGLRWARIISQAEAEAEKEEQKREKEREPSLRFSYRYRDLDNPIMPSSGGSFSLESSLVGWILGGTRDYYSVDFDYRRFRSLGSSAVVAFRTKIGTMRPIGKPPEGETLLQQIPSYDRFFLGGSTSLRGWKSQRFHTYKDAEGVERAEGGLVKVLMNAEVRIPIWWLFGVDMFVEGGILASSISELQGETKKWLKGTGWNYGIELTVSTPLGPIRLSYAVPFRVPLDKGTLNLGVPYAF